MLSFIISEAIIAFVALAPCVTAIPLTNNTLFKRDPPQGLGTCATEWDLRWQPVMDFDTDGCYNTPAIGADGTLNPGLDNCYTTTDAFCRDRSDLENNNIYSRARCNFGWCGFMYGYYFEKDVGIDGVCGVGAGHRHDWEHVVVYVEMSVNLPRYVSVSQHAEWEIRSYDEIMKEGERPKIVYHKDGGSTHAFRFAQDGDDSIENDFGSWFQGALISWEGYPEGVRDTLTGNDWGSATMSISDAVFFDALENAKMGLEIPLDTSFDDEGVSPGTPVVGCT